MQACTQLMRVKNSFITVHAIPSASLIAAGQLSGGWRWAARGAADGHGECPLARVAAGGERQRAAGPAGLWLKDAPTPLGGPEVARVIWPVKLPDGVIVIVLVLVDPDS